MKTRVLYEDKDIIVIYKPAGLATQTARIGQQDVVSELKNYLASGAKTVGGQKGAPYVGVIHRLDQPVEGLLVFAKTPKAAASLQVQLKEQKLLKGYYAVVCGKPQPEEGTLVDYLVKDNALAQAKVVSSAYPQAKKAVLEYRLEESQQMKIGAFTDAEVDESVKEIPVSLVDICLETGRFHQIRAQMSHRGLPLLGDQKYGNMDSAILSEALGISNVALCAWSLCFIHPMREEKMEYTVIPENKAFTVFQNFFH